MTLEYYSGRRHSIDRIRKELKTDTDGTDRQEAIRFLRRRGFRVRDLGDLTIPQLADYMKKGIAIVDVDRDHVAVVHDVGIDGVHVADPAINRRFKAIYSRKEFSAKWGGRALLVSKAGTRPTLAIAEEQEVRCPVSGGMVRLDSEQDAVYPCPDCEGDITTDSECQPSHEDIVCYQCPISGEQEFIWRSDWEEADELYCASCNSWIRLDCDSRDNLQVFHPLEYEVR